VHPSAGEHLVDPVEHLGGAVLGQLHLDLGPGRGAGLGAEGVAGDPVVGDGGDGVAGGVGQRPLPADGGKFDNGLEPYTAVADSANSVGSRGVGASRSGAPAAAAPSSATRPASTGPSDSHLRSVSRTVVVPLVSPTACS